MHAGWADKLARTLGISLASVAPSVWHGATGRAVHAHGANATVLTELELSRAAQKAVALAQQEKSTWTRADVIKYLGRALPRSGMNPAAAATLLEHLADRALRSEFEPVVCLEAPEPAEVPRSLLRADGRSVYQRHGGTRYATRAQLAMEERMLTQAGASGAARLTRAQAARALGADPAQLDDALAGRATDTHAPRTQTGLRADQAAAALSVLTDGKRVSVIDAPAGSGKTWVLTETGRAWTATGLGPVEGITAAQPARNTLAAGVPVSYNSAQFLGHLPGRRAARGPVEAGRRPLLLVDEASTMPGPDLADLIAYAQARDGKLILAGDTSQLQAVENGGGMSLLADALGYARLAEPARFRAAWEQAASLRLRDGDTTVLADYDQHGRIHGGDPEQMIDAATAAYVALTCDGTDTLLMAAEHALRRELSRRIREDLIALGIVQPGPAVRIADGATASPGDLITATRNDHTLQAGQPGRTLAPEDPCRPSPATTSDFPESTRSEDLAAGAIDEVEVRVRTGSERLRTLGRHGGGTGRRNWSRTGRGPLTVNVSRSLGTSQHRRRLPAGPPRARPRVRRTVSVARGFGPRGRGPRRRGWYRSAPGMPGVCINQGEAAGQPTDPALTSATLGTGGVRRSGTAVR